ncbi:C39 family peptidase [Caldovatus aquaticus]|uniref:C39 family peptidase n=1 Tax=Caldovatus aquaticus TaxID=2865671 RepID=A0ABS7EYA6_9PROT|nr:C39 family peptidase [Caldovatus aquaticus]MBW8268338.1 C39 family peptidase [Caldovatus aquaticus]
MGGQRFQARIAAGAIAALALLAAGCAAQAPGGAGAPAPARVMLSETATGGPNLLLPVRDIRSRRFATTIRQRFDYSCGSAALATLLTYHYGLPTTEEEVLRDMIAHGDAERIRTAGFSLLDMRNYLARRGLRANGYRLPLARLAEARIPGIALIDTNGYRHFVVVRGLSEDRVLLADPNLGTRTMPRVRFEEAWSGVLFVILDHPEIAQASFNRPEDWGVRPRAPGTLVREAMDGGLHGLGMPSPILLNSGEPPLRWLF